ncbi:Plasminogen receptor (KT) [Geodia barretti]|uniref:Plasminogen receptor (KT) n=1 Tax=Geodia barretti TaxID=519541 RepID=A0AA35WJE8_GEOBA|nr:Plasminogen receptor (KT) [Geodia barretti]
MGGYLSKRMEGMMKEMTRENQEFMLKAQAMQVERQLQMQTLMREKMLAQQLAMARERLYWWGGFYALASLGLIRGAMVRRQPWILGPLVPLTFVVAYQADLAYGNKMERVIAEADSMLEKERKMLALPGAPLSIDLLDSRRKK